MPQSLARVHIHLIFSTKKREPLINDGIREPLHRYIAVVLQNFGSPADLINSVEDHVLGRTASISQVVEEIKTTSSEWLKTQNDALNQFTWYGAFAVSESNLDTVRQYIANQREHHRTKTFQEEYRTFLRKHNVPFDERYLWD
jgi:putative transposase